LHKHSSAKPEDSEEVIVGGEGVDNTDYNHCPLTVEEDQFTSQLVRQNGADYSAKHHTKNEEGLCEVLQISAFTDQIPL